MSACAENYLPTLVQADQLAQKAKYNGDIYVVNVTEIKLDYYTTEQPAPIYRDTIDFDEIMNTCNQSFITPMEYLVEFNKTGVLPNTIDKTYMCYIKCFYMRTGFIQPDWRLNAEQIRKYVWPATGDSLEFCEQAEKTEMNSCVRAYSIAKCLMIRAIVDAKSKPTK